MDSFRVVSCGMRRELMKLALLRMMTWVGPTWALGKWMDGDVGLSVLGR